MKHDSKPNAPKDKKPEADKQQRIAQERGAADPNYRPTEKDAQIDGSGARFKSDG